MHFPKFFLENANNEKNIWRVIKSIINVNSSVNYQPTSLLVNSELTTEPKEIANAFNKYFSTIASDLQGKIYHHGQDFTIFLKNSDEHNFFISPSDKNEIVSIINNSSKKKATGPLLHTAYLLIFFT